MKIPSEQGPITVHGSQEASRRAEGSWMDSKAIHNIDEAKAYQQYKHKRENAASVDQPKPMLLCEDTVMVKKAKGKWRMRIDFTDLNKACLKDEFSLPRIDSLVDAAATSELMSLLDCYSFYHQIWMKKDNEPKTSFITPSGTYCYLRMPEGLKNAGGSFSRMTAKVLHSQIGRNVLTYVDDIIVKSTKQENHVADLQETFTNFRQAGLKLNPEKCVFGVKKGMFLGCLVSIKGIEANPSKIEAILRMEPPNSKKGLKG
jgi:hypothetical protein